MFPARRRAYDPKFLARVSRYAHAEHGKDFTVHCPGFDVCMPYIQGEDFPPGRDLEMLLRQRDLVQRIAMSGAFDDLFLVFGAVESFLMEFALWHENFLIELEDYNLTAEWDLASPSVATLTESMPALERLRDYLQSGVERDQIQIQFVKRKKG